jgi:hypothetical protein
MEEKNGIWINPLCEKIDIDSKGPFVKIKEDVIMTVESKGVKVSNDDGKTWSEPIFVCEGISDKEPASKYLLLTRKGTLIALPEF